MTRRHTILLGCVLVGGFALAARAAMPPASTPLGAWRTSLLSPARVAVDAGGRVYATEPGSGRVLVFDAFGRLVSHQGGLAQPLAIAVDVAGRIYLGEEGTGSVTVFDSQWNLLHKLGGGEGEFALPNYIAIDPAPERATVYVADSLAHEVKVYSNGVLALAFGSLGTNTGQFDFPAGIFASTNGEIFVVDQNNNRVQVFGRTGAFLRQFNTITTSGSALGGSAGGKCQGITGDSSGRLYVTDALQGLINVFDPQGVLLSTMCGFGEASGQLRSPGGLVVDQGNRLIIASVNNGRLEMLGIDAFIHLASQPATRIVGVGSDVTFSAAAGGAGPVTYQWRKSGVELTNGGNISGATNAALTLTGIATGDAGDYSVLVTEASGTFLSPAAPLTVVTPPNITTQPVSQTVTQGSGITFTVTAEGDAPEFQWQFNRADIPGATTSTLHITNAGPAQSGSYSIKVINLVGTASSAEAVLTVVAPPLVTVPPSGQQILHGRDLRLQVTAGGDALNYQWLFNGAVIPGATTETLDVTNLLQSGAGEYAVVVGNFGGSVTSSVAFVSVLMSPFITSLSPHQTISLGGSALLQVNVLGAGPFTYQWRLGGNALPGAASNVLLLSNARWEQAGAYSVLVSNVFEATTSAPVVLSLFGIELDPPGIGTSARLQLAGASLMPYRVEFKTDLEDANWLTLTNVILPGGLFHFFDPGSSPMSRRFYRAYPEPTTP